MTPRSGPEGGAQRYLRVAGRTLLVDGRDLVWSMAEGRRGRRWRATVLRGDELLEAMLLEVSPVGRPSRLELTTSAGALTLHPEPDERSIHGNVVGADGVRPLALPWSAAHELELTGLPFGAAVAIARQGRDRGVGEWTEFPVLAVADDLTIVDGRRTIVRLGDATWRVTDELGATIELVVHGNGLIDADTTWDLEPGLDPHVWEDGGQGAPETGAIRETRG